MNIGDRVQIKQPSLFDPHHSKPIVGTIVRLPVPDGDRLHHLRFLVQVGAEIRPRPVLEEHLVVLGKSDTSIPEIEDIWKQAKELRAAKFAAIEKALAKPAEVALTKPPEAA